MKAGRQLFHQADEEILRDRLKVIPEKSDLDGCFQVI